MTASGELRSGKGSRDENFPVASFLIARRHRPIILTFYEFVRVADDIADHGSLSAAEKRARLDSLEATLTGRSDTEPEGVKLRAMLQSRGLASRHALELLSAFRQDVTKHRYTSWEDLIDYCSRSAMPVGRFVLDVHGESHDTWPASDALCAALQIINHIQDCAKDYCTLDRVYIPLPMLEERGTGVEALAKSRSSPELLACLQALTARTALLLERSRGFADSINDRWLSAEVAVIQALAERLIAILQTRDPLSETVHLRRRDALSLAARAAGRNLLHRLFRGGALARRLQTP